MNSIEEKLKKLIRNEGLDNPEVFFADYETFEEIPFFSRWSDISFLSPLSFDEKNTILIKNAIELIEKNTSLAEKIIGRANSDEFFACLTLTGWDVAEEMGCLKPNLFLSRRKSWLLSNLNLKQSNATEENLTRKYLSAIHMKKFSVLTSDGFTQNKRVYVMIN